VNTSPSLNWSVISSKAIELAEQLRVASIGRQHPVDLAKLAAMLTSSSWVFRSRNHIDLAAAPESPGGTSARRT
jgi:hypothetical protein